VAESLGLGGIGEDTMTEDPKAPPSRTPPTHDRDLALGRFMSAWSEVEGALRRLLIVLSGAPWQTAISIAAAIPDFGRMQELLRALSVMQLANKEDRDELEAICSYFLISNRYRNAIVHGEWGLSWTTGDGVDAPAVWFRGYLNIDITKRIQAQGGRDKSAADQYVFSIERLNERADKAIKFAERIAAFSKGIEGKVQLPENGP
jgi:hypothetical protein